MVMESGSGLCSHATRFPSKNDQSLPRNSMVGRGAVPPSPPTVVFAKGANNLAFLSSAAATRSSEMHAESLPIRRQRGGAHELQCPVLGLLTVDDDDDDDGREEDAYGKLLSSSSPSPSSSSFPEPDKTSLLLASLHELSNKNNNNDNNSTIATSSPPSPLGTSEQTNLPHNDTFRLTSSSLTSLRRKAGQSYYNNSDSITHSTTTTVTPAPVGRKTTSLAVPQDRLPSNSTVQSSQPSNDKSFKDKVSKKVGFDIPPMEMEASSAGGGRTTGEAQVNQNQVIGAENTSSADKENHQEEGGGGEQEKNKFHQTSQAPTTSPSSSSPEEAKKGGHSSSTERRWSRSPGGNIMREIRKMSLASQDAREAKKKRRNKAKEEAAAGSKEAGGDDGSGAGGTGRGAAGSGPSPGGTKLSRRLARRRKRKEEEYTDKDRAAAVTLGSRDIKQSLKAKKKRERKLRISVDLLHNEEFLSSMLVVEAAYQMRVKKQIKEALTTLNKALELQPTHRGALVARSQCHLKLGDASAALRDAEACFDGNEVYIMGLYQYAEALYNLGYFEKALIAYHRGYRTRKLESFRIGIQKAQDAIQRAIGDCRRTPMEDLEELLPLMDELEVSTNCRTAGGPGNSVKYVGDTTGHTFELPLNKQHNQVTAIPASSSGVASSAPLPASQTTHYELRAGSATAPASGSWPEKTSLSGRNRWVAREALGQMYLDKDYLTKFLLRKDIHAAADQGASQQLRANATEALNYLEIREQFWRQQNPMYTRKQGLPGLKGNTQEAIQAPVLSEKIMSIMSGDTTKSKDPATSRLPKALEGGILKQESKHNGRQSRERKQSNSSSSHRQHDGRSSEPVIPVVLVNETSESKSGSAKKNSQRSSHT